MSTSEDKKDLEANANESSGSVDEPLDLTEGGSLEDTQRRRRRRGGLRVPSDNVPRPQAAASRPPAEPAAPLPMPMRDSSPVVMKAVTGVAAAAAVVATEPEPEPDEDVDVDVDMDDGEPAVASASAPAPAQKVRSNGSSGPHRAPTEVEELADSDLVEEPAVERARTEPPSPDAAEELSEDEIEEASAEEVEQAAAPTVEVHDVDHRPIMDARPVDAASVAANASAPNASPPGASAPNVSAPHVPPPLPVPAAAAPVAPLASTESKPMAAVPPPRPPAAPIDAAPAAAKPSPPPAPIAPPTLVSGSVPVARPAPPPVASARPPGASGPHAPVPHAPPPPPPAAPAKPRSSAAAAAAAAAAAEPKPKKRKGRAWYEEIFDDDYLRTLPFLTPQATQREAGFITDALAVKAGQQVLDVGCGYGRHAMELAARGYHVVALDLSLPLLLRGADEAQRRGLTINFVHGDMRELAFESQFDGAYCVFSTFGYFDDETNRRVAMNVARALKPGGRLVVDVLNRDYIIADLPTRVWWEGDGCVVLEEVDFNYYTSRLVSNRSVVFEDGRQLEQEISIRAYGLHELGKLLHQAGFRVLEVSGNLAARGRFFGNHSRQMIVVAEKRADKGDPSRDTLSPIGTASAAGSDKDRTQS